MYVMFLTGAATVLAAAVATLADLIGAAGLADCVSCLMYVLLIGFYFVAAKLAKVL